MKIFHAVFFSAALLLSACGDFHSSADGLVFPTGSVDGTFVDTRDSQTYRTVTIGAQTWMAENLNFKTENSFYYNNSAEYGKKYGRLYTWTAAQTACPSGWHLPTNKDFETLFAAVGGSSVAGDKLKSASGWYGDRGGSGAYAFAARPAGYWGNNGRFQGEKFSTFFWSSTEYSRDDAYNMALDYVDGKAFLSYDYKSDGFSVRCVKD